MSIKTKFYFNTVLLVLMILVIGLVKFYASVRLDSVLEKNHSISHLIENSININIATFDYLLDFSERAEKQWFLNHQALGMSLNEVTFKPKYEQMLLSKIKRNHANLQILFPLLMKNHTGIEGTKNTKEHHELNSRLISQLMVKTQDIIFTAEQLNTINANELAGIQKDNNFIVLFTLVLMSAIITLNSIIIGKSILNPINHLLSGTKIIAKGNLNHKIKITKKDEIGELSMSFDNMTDRLQNITVSRNELEKEISIRLEAEESLKFRTLDLGKLVK